MVLIYVKRVCETKGQQESQALAYSYKARSADVVSDVHWKKTNVNLRPTCTCANILFDCKSHLRPVVHVSETLLSDGIEK